MVPIFADKVAFVTGAASGIGRGIARAFVEAGGRVVIADLDLVGGAAVAAECGDERSLFVRTDVTDEENVAQAVQAGVERFNRIDCLVNNAGQLGVRGPVQDMDIASFKKTIDLLLTSVAITTKHVVPIFLRQQAGSIVNIASIAGLRGDPQAPTYSAGKAAVMGFTRATALQLAPHGIRVNAIAPGGIVTPGYKDIIEWGPDGFSEAKLREIFKTTQPLPYAGEAEDIGNAVVFLASEHARFITGETLTIDGGLTAIMSAQVEQMRAGKS